MKSNHRILSNFHLQNKYTAQVLREVHIVLQKGIWTGKTDWQQ